MVQPKGNMVRVMAIVCLVAGMLRLLACLHPVSIGFVGFPAQFVFMVLSSAWLVFAGVFGLVCWHRPEKLPLIIKVATLAIIFDVAFLVLSMALWIAVLLLGLPMSFIFLSIPCTVGYIVVAKNYQTNLELFHSTQSGVLIMLKAFPRDNRIVNGMALCMFGILLAMCVTLVRWHVHISQENIPLTEAIPWGVWESPDNNLTLYINPQYSLSLTTGAGFYKYPGIYTTPYGEYKIFVSFESGRGMIGRYRPHFMNIRCPDRRIPPRHSTGDGFQVIDYQLRVTTHNGYIIFYPVHSYPSIDLALWAR